MFPPEEPELPDELEFPEEPELPEELELPEDPELPEELEFPEEPELPEELEFPELLEEVPFEYEVSVLTGLLPLLTHKVIFLRLPLLNVVFFTMLC